MLSSARSQVVLLASIVFMAMFNLTLVSPVLPEFVKDRFEMTDLAIGLFTSAEMIAYIIFAPVWGVLSDRRERRVPFVVMGLGMSAIFFVIMPLIDVFWLLVVVRFVQGAFTVAAWSLAMTMALDWAGEENRGRTMGVLGAGMMMGMALGAPMGGVLGERWTIEGPFYLAFVVFVMAFVSSLLFIREPISRRSKVRATVPIKEEADLWIPGAFGFVERFTAGFFITLFPVFLLEEFDFGSGLRGMYLGIFFLPFAVFQYPFGRLTDRWGPLPFMVLGSIVYGAIMMVVTFLQPVPLAAGMILLGTMAAGMLPASLVLVGAFSRPETHGRAMGLFNALGSVGFAAGLLLSAVFAEVWNYSASFIIGGVSVLVVVVMTFVPLVRKFRWWEKGERDLSQGA
ncbi:MAG: MFS transporter [Thermoplasmata archaeon]|nr:MFS transporter [Thermoplasmata archaeon]NIS13329.1 MFS transporter [Thermoplasmata archaeon]NIS21221.1 MFS transporter [Thermoplasmata archaeon]NIT78718.1 MFS transporter [Thermoplasmata archaeon]NIU50275.1 MFS transporter [Thermoplasmata archaeon]